MAALLMKPDIGLTNQAALNSWCRRAQGAIDGTAPIMRSRLERPRAIRRADFTDLHARHVDAGRAVAFAALAATHCGPPQPRYSPSAAPPETELARVRAAVKPARPRVKCFIAQHKWKDGHIVPASNFRQWLPAYISAAFAKPLVFRRRRRHSVRLPVRGSF